MRTAPRNVLTASAVAGLLLVGGCGSSSSTTAAPKSGSGSGSSSTGTASKAATPLAVDSVAVVRDAGKKVIGSGSSKLTLTSSTKVGTQTIVFGGDGIFDYSHKLGQLVIKLPATGSARGAEIQERITGGNLYLALPNMPGSFYKVSLADIGGTSLGSSSDPTASFSTLSSVSQGVQKLGTEQVRGASTTHYRGSVDVVKATAKTTGIAHDLVQGLLKNGLKTLPFDAYVDDQGRLRKYVQTVALPASAKTAGKPINSTTTIELYDFGTKVDVQPPPAAQVKDGAPLLKALKSAGSAAGS